MKLSRPFLYFFLPICFGIATFFLIAGPLFLNPTSLNNIHTPDNSQHYLAWEIFRADRWHWPLGMNPKYGLDAAASIVFSDSIPLLAFLFKPFAKLLPQPFQYLGIWTLICFILQALFAWLLAGLMGRQTLIRCLVMALLVFSPPLLLRVGLHTALVSHFYIIAALYLIFTKSAKRPFIWWLILLITSLLTHSYIFLIIFTLWFANLFDLCITQKKISFKNLVFTLMIFAPILWATFWVTGYFVDRIDTIASVGFGHHPINFFTLVDPDGWSYLLPNISRGNFSFEGFMYLGLGMLFLVPFALVSFFQNTAWFYQKIASHLFLVLALLGLLLLAITNQIYIGNFHFEIPLPASLIQWLSIIRASARMFWPIYYLIALFILLLVVRSYSPKNAAILLSVGLMLQIIDTSAAWLPRRLEFARVKPYQTHLQHPFWQSAAHLYDKVICVIPQNAVQVDWNWVIFARYAAANHLGTNAAYLSRITLPINRPINNEQYEKALSQGRFESGAFYILDPQKILPVLAHMNPKTDLLATIDQQIVFAPNYVQCNPCAKISPQMRLLGPIIYPSIGKRFSFASFSPFARTPYLSQGWLPPDQRGAQFSEKIASMSLPLPNDGQAHVLKLRMGALLPMEQPHQLIELWANGSKVQDISLNSQTNGLVSIPITPAITKEGYVMLHFKLLDPPMPKKDVLDSPKPSPKIRIFDGIYE